jgi:hypothetical protein
MLRVAMDELWTETEVVAAHGKAEDMDGDEPAAAVALIVRSTGVRETDHLVAQLNWRALLGYTA